MLIIGGIARKLIPSRLGLVFWTTVFLVLGIPVTLAPTLRAYPDIGAAALIGLAILTYLHDPKLSKWWQLILMAFLLGMAILYRRHFIYSGLSIFIAMSLQAILGFTRIIRQNRSKAWMDLFTAGIRIGIVAVLTILCLAIFGRPFLIRVLTINYSVLYASYVLPPGVVLNYYATNYGWIILFLTAFGFVIGTIKRVLDQSVTEFLLLQSGVLFLLWLLLARQIGVHYTLHFTPIVLLGLSAFFWTIWLTMKGTLRNSIVLVGMAYIVFNAVTVLSPYPINPEIQLITSYRYPPLQRSDYNQIVNLIEFLRTTIPDRGPIYVVDSSWRMNFDILIKAEQALYNDQKLNVFVTPQIDSRDFYPLEMLIKADYVIVSTPLQTHLSNPEEQKVVQVVSQAFTENWRIAKDFIHLPEQFALSDEVVLSVYQRITPTTPETAVLTFNLMQKLIGQRPGNQPDWIDLSPVSSNPIIKTGNDANQLKIKILPDGVGISTYFLLYAHPAPDSGQISGTWKFLDNSECKFLLGVEVREEYGQVITENTNEIDSITTDRTFSLDFKHLNSGYLLMYVKPNSEMTATKPCSIELKWGIKTH
jgi:hypothetical protein